MTVLIRSASILYEPHSLISDFASFSFREKERLATTSDSPLSPARASPSTPPSSPPRVRHSKPCIHPLTPPSSPPRLRPRRAEESKANDSSTLRSIRCHAAEEDIVDPIVNSA